MATVPVFTRDLPLQVTVDALNQINPDLAHHYAVNHVEIRKKLNEAMRQNIDLGACAVGSE